MIARPLVLGLLVVAAAPIAAGNPRGSRGDGAQRSAQQAGMSATNQALACSRCSQERCSAPTAACYAQCQARPPHLQARCGETCYDRYVACGAQSCRPCRGLLAGRQGVQGYGIPVGDAAPGGTGGTSTIPVEAAPPGSAPPPRMRVMRMRRR